MNRRLNLISKIPQASILYAGLFFSSWLFLVLIAKLFSIIVASWHVLTSCPYTYTLTFTATLLIFSQQIDKY